MIAVYKYMQINFVWCRHKIDDQRNTDQALVTLPLNTIKDQLIILFYNGNVSFFL
jgi:hypothetical protein